MAASNYPPSEEPLTITHGKEMTWRLWLKWKLLTLIYKAKAGLELTCNERGIVARWITRNVTTSIEETLDEMER